MCSFPDAGMRRPHPRWAADVRKLAQIQTLPYCRCADRCRRRPSCAALTMCPVISPLATASTRCAASRRASCSLRSAAALSRDRLREPRPFLGKVPAGGLNHGGVLEVLAQATEHRVLDQLKPALAVIRAIPRLDRAGAPRNFRRLKQGPSTPNPISKGGAARGLWLDFRRKKQGAAASPQPRPTSPVDGAGGLTGCHNDAQGQKSFLLAQNIFTRLVDRPVLEPPCRDQR